MSLGGSQQHTIALGTTAHLDLSPPPRADGYKELALAAQMWANFAGFHGTRASYWRGINAARRLDLGHRQIERVRAGIDSFTGSHGSNAMRRNEELLVVLGDAQLAMICLYRAASMAEQISRGVSVNFPSSVRRHMDPALGVPAHLSTRH